jgi:hypothetical protein
LNELLKTPIFEIRRVSFEELAEAEREHDLVGGNSGGNALVLGGCLGTLLQLSIWMLIPAALLSGGRCLSSGCGSFLTDTVSAFLSILKWVGIVAIVVCVVAGILYSRLKWLGKKPASQGDDVTP